MTKIKYKFKKGLIVEKLDGKIVIFDTDQSVLYNFNQTASFIFQKLKKGYHKDKILELLLKNYRVKKENAEKDLNGLINDLKEKKIIIEENKNQ